MVPGRESVGVRQVGRWRSGSLHGCIADGTDVRLVTVMEEGSGSWWPVWSPSGSEILVSCVTVCVVDAEDGSLVGRSPINLHGGNIAAWSPDGSRIAVMGEYSSRNGSIALYTMARDGTDLQVLVRGSRSLVAENSGWQDPDVGVASCSAGFVVAEPETNPGLVRDCEILMRARGVLVGMNRWRPYRSDLSGGSPESTWGDVVMNWGPGTPIDQWTGVRIEDVCVPPSRLGTDGCRLAHPLVEPILGPPTHYASIAPVWRFRQLFTLPEGRVTGLQLGGGSPSNNTNFTGTIPHELGDLVYLRSLDLSRYAGGSSRSPAALSGGIPPELGRLQLLRELDLGHNQLTGSIPNELGRLVSLRTLDLRRNRLGGSIPQELDGLTELSTLRLDNNQLTGSIPPELGRLTKLRRLWLTENQLTGSIPPELGRLTKLQGLWLSENQLTGKVPSELGGITPLARLNLSGNRFECLPAELVYKHDLEIDARGLETCLASSYAFQVSELAAVGHLVGAVFATDADAVSYSITAGNEDGRFAIDADSGEITVAGPLDAEAVSSYGLDLQGIGETGEAVAASVMITVISRLEPCSRGIAVPDPGDNPELVSDCALLLEARDTLDRSRYSFAPYNLNWSAATPMADWRGVRVGGSPRRVQTLDLNIGNWGEIYGDAIPPPLSGELAPELGGLTGLWGLDLYYSSIGGEIPPEWENLSGLKVLYLNTRRLTGCIPASLRDVEHTNLGSWSFRTATRGESPDGWQAQYELGKRRDITKRHSGMGRCIGPHAVVVSLYPVEMTPWRYRRRRGTRHTPNQARGQDYRGRLAGPWGHTRRHPPRGPRPRCLRQSAQVRAAGTPRRIGRRTPPHPPPPQRGSRASDPARSDCHRPIARTAPNPYHPSNTPAKGDLCATLPPQSRRASDPSFPHPHSRHSRAGGNPEGGARGGSTPTIIKTAQPPEATSGSPKAINHPFCTFQLQYPQKNAWTIIRS